MSCDNSLENYKYRLLNHSLELNEYAKENSTIPVEYYKILLENSLIVLDSYIDSEEVNNEFKRKIGDAMGVPYFK
ncbi:hypothetical protein [Niallia taxi]|uniref:hypothetical protein n=1 Tax=Niallia taxi TaxID=2499688 RepID=UPI0030094E29